MYNKKILLLTTITAVVFLLCSTMGTLALSPGLYVDPGTITVPGESTQITLVTPVRATGTLKVKCIASNQEWSTTVDTGSTGVQSWKFPDDFPGADTNTLGMYDVVADITMSVGKFVWNTTFMVEFFVIPDLPFGPIMAVGACFVGTVGYKKLRRHPTK